MQEQNPAYNAMKLLESKDRNKTMKLLLKDSREHSIQTLFDCEIKRFSVFLFY